VIETGSPQVKRFRIRRGRGERQAEKSPGILILTGRIGLDTRGEERGGRRFGIGHGEREILNCEACR
jgi:hypothetical protein